MFKPLALAASAALLVSSASAQQVTCATRPAGDSSNACASTAFAGTAITNLLGSNNTWTGTNTYTGSVLLTYENIGALVTGAGSWITGAGVDAIAAFPALNPLQIVSPNGSRALGVYSRQSDYVPGQGVYAPETYVNFTYIDTAPPSAAIFGTWGEYVEFDQTWTGNYNILAREDDIYTKTNSYYAAISGDPYYNGWQVGGTPTYAGSTLTISGVASIAGRAPVAGTYVYISGITATSGTNPNGFYPIAGVTGTGPYNLTFTITGVTGTPGGTALVLIAGHSANHRLACGAGRVGSNACSDAIELIPNNSVYEAGIVVGVGSLDLTSPAVTSATHSAGVATLNFAASPPWAVQGNQITVTGATGDTTINGTWVVASSTPTSVTYSVAGSGSPAGTIITTRTSAPGIIMAEQQSLRWNGSAGTTYADIYELNSGGLPTLHIAMPVTGSSLSFEFQGLQQLGMNTSTFYPTFGNTYSLGSSTNGFKSIYSSGPIIVGGHPTSSGACVASTIVGGLTTGGFSPATCAGTTLTLTGFPATPNGYTCFAVDQTTTTNTLVQTASTTTSVSFKATTTSGDFVNFTCQGW